VKRALAIAAGLALLVMIAAGVALYFFDPETLREPLQKQATSALGRDVKLGELSLAILPLPAVRVTQIRVAGPTPKDPPFAEIAELRLRVAILPLLARKVVLRALEIDSPRVNIPFDKDGKPILPGPAAGPAKPPKAGAEPPAETSGGGAPALAVDRIAIDDARVQAGPWLIENADVAGRLGLDGSGDFRFSLDVPNLVELRSGRLELAGLGGKSLEIEARGEFATELANVRKRFELAPELGGHARGDYEVELVAGVLRVAKASVDVPDLLVRQNDLVVSGPTRAHAVLGESYSLDLSDARVEKKDVFAKPKGTPLSVTGKLGPESDRGALRDALVKIGRNEVPLGLELGKKPMRVRLEKSTLDLAAFRELLPPDKPPLSGTVAVDGLDVELAPLRVTGGARLDKVTATLEHGPIELSGPVRARGREIALEDASAVIGGQTIALGGRYDLESGALGATFDAKGSQLGALLNALSGRSEVDGTLLANGKIDAARAEVAALVGGGRIEIAPGRIRGFSLAKSVLGPLAALPQLAANTKGKDLSKYDNEEFQRLSADYRIANGRVASDNLEIVYKEAAAFLKGSVGLSDRTLDLTGRVVLTKETDAELAGTKAAKERVIPIAHIGGTVDAPRVELDQKTLAALALAYTGNDKVREKLDKALGPGASEAVEGILGNLLGGPKK
jgi:uncharacterized protein involved in outer membrane biogenesis